MPVERSAVGWRVVAMLLRPVSVSLVGRARDLVSRRVRVNIVDSCGCQMQAYIVW